MHVARKRWSATLLTAGGLLIVQGALRAEEAQLPASLFGAEQENIVRWARLAGILAVVLALGLVLAVVVQGHPRVSATGKWLLLLGAVVLPAFHTLVGWQVGLHQSKTVSSCASCHTMEPYLRDMRNSDSRTLAAQHFQNRWIPHNQCYECHTDYGLLGDLSAKSDGLGHILKYCAGSYEEPIRPRKAYGLGHCLKCHAGAKGYEELAEHREPEVVESLRKGTMSCLECHAAPHPRPGKRDGRPAAPAGAK